MAYVPHYPAPNYGMSQPPDPSSAFFARPNGPWWRMPIELRHMVLDWVGIHQLFRATAKSAHWFTLDTRACRAPRSERDRRNAHIRDMRMWLPEHPNSFMRIAPMTRPLILREGNDGYMHSRDAPQVVSWPNHTSYFSRLNPSMSRRRRNFFRMRVPGYAEALKRIIRTASGTGRPFIFAPVPRAEQLSRQWLMMRPTALVNGLPPSAPPPPAYPQDGLSYMVIDSADDLVIFQSNRPLPNPDFLGNIPLIDHYLVSAVYPQMQHQRQIGYEVNLDGAENGIFQTPNDFLFFGDDDGDGGGGGPENFFGLHPAWQPLFWSVVHFPRLETVWLINYEIQPLMVPPAADRRFQARGMSFYEVRRPHPHGPQIWANCEQFVTLAERFENMMVSHWEAWCFTRLENTGGHERVTSVVSAVPLTPGNYTMGDPPPMTPGYPLVTEFWDRRQPYEPEYWQRLAPSGPTPRIRVKVLAVVRHGPVDEDCKDDPDEGRL